MNWFCNTFVPCDKTRETITLGDIKPTEGMVESYIVFLDNDGAVNTIDVPGFKNGVKEKYYYWEDGEDGPGWYLSDDDEDLEHNMNTKRTIKLGEAFYVRCAGELDEGLTYAGAVDAESVPLSMTNSKMNWFGNCSPTDIKIGDVMPSEGFVESYIVFLDNDGAVSTVDVDGFKTGVKEKYYYWDGEDGLGWYLSDDDEDLEHNQNTKRTIKAGESFYIRCAGEIGEGIIIPSALPKK